MTKPELLNKRYIGFNVIGAQALTSTIIPVIVLLTAGKSAALAALVGGWIATAANLYFVLQAFRFSGARSSQDVVGAFYRGEAGKFAMVMLLLVAAFKLVPGMGDSVGYLLAVFFVVYGVGCVAPFFVRAKR